MHRSSGTDAATDRAPGRLAHRGGACRGQVCRGSAVERCGRSAA